MKKKCMPSSDAADSLMLTMDYNPKAQSDYKIMEEPSAKWY
jgi:hypothetical protein